MSFPAFQTLPACDLRTLNYAEHFTVWAVRTSVACSAQCRTLLREFQTAFGLHTSEGVRAYHDLMRSLSKGRRKVQIGRPGHIDMTSDEMTLIEVMRAAQHGDEARFRAHARWIMGQENLYDLYETARSFTHMLRERGHSYRPFASGKPHPNRSREGIAV